MIDWISFWMIVVTAVGLGLIFYFVERTRVIIEEYNRECADADAEIKRYNKERSKDESYPA
jgi:hypothetical protein